MDNEIICEAKIKIKPNKKVFIIWYFVVSVILIIGDLPNTTKISDDHECIVQEKDNNWLFIDVGGYDYLIAKSDGYYALRNKSYSSSITADYLAKEHDKAVEEFSNGSYIDDSLKNVKKGEKIYKINKRTDDIAYYIAFIITLFILLLPVFVIILYNLISKECKLTLTSTGISGVRKKIFSTNNFDFPIDKIDSVVRSITLFNNIFGGTTVVVSSASEKIVFPWVQNAEEFVDVTLAKIDEFKQQMKKDNKSIINAVEKTIQSNSSDSTSVEKMKELKELLDLGLISNEEYEAKRLELLKKIL